MKRISHNELIRFGVEVLSRYGVNRTDAKIIVENLVLANLRGKDSHGIIRLYYYIEDMKRNYINPRPKIKMIKERKHYALIDGDNGFGQVVALRATELAIEKAKENDIALVAAKNLSHVGILAYYIMRIINNAMAGFATANTDPAIAPPCARVAALGTNPIAIGVPTEGALPPIILDMALSVVSGGRILLAARRGEKIPLGWAIDSQGRPTNDPREALKGALLPMGGHKGYGLALMIDILCGIVIGGGYSLKIRPGWSSQGGFLVSALKIDSFRNSEEYYTEINEYVKRIKTLPLVEGCKEVFIPGEQSFKVMQERLKKGIPLDEDTWSMLSKLAQEAGVEMPKTLP